MGNQEWTIHKHLHRCCAHYTGRRQTYQKQKQNKENKDKNKTSKNN